MRLEELHHAYTWRTGGTAQSILDALALSASEAALDVLYLDEQTLGIDTVRRLSEVALLKPVRLPRRIVAASFAYATPDAQHALLKLLEEPPGWAVVFLLTPYPDALLATVRSRTMAFDASTHPTAQPDGRAAAFLAAPRSERVQIATALSEKGDTDERNLRDIMAFLDGLEREAGASHLEEARREWLSLVYRTKRALVPGAPVKMLLEQLAYLLPRTRA